MIPDCSKEKCCYECLIYGGYTNDFSTYGRGVSAQQKDCKSLKVAIVFFFVSFFRVFFSHLFFASFFRVFFLVFFSHLFFAYYSRREKSSAKVARSNNHFAHISDYKYWEFFFKTKPRQLPMGYEFISLWLQRKSLRTRQHLGVGPQFANGLKKLS